MEAQTELVIRNANKSVYAKFKREALQEDLNVGEAITEAMLSWLNERQQKARPNPKNLLKLNGILRAGKKVRWSEQIDEMLYG